MSRRRDYSKRIHTHAHAHIGTRTHKVTQGDSQRRKMAARRPKNMADLSFWKKKKKERKKKKRKKKKKKKKKVDEKNINVRFE